MENDSTTLCWIDPPDHALDDLKAKVAAHELRERARIALTSVAIIAIGTTALVYELRNSKPTNALGEHDWRAAISAHDNKFRVVNGAALELSPPGAKTRVYLVSTSSIPDQLDSE